MLYKKLHSEVNTLLSAMADDNGVISFQEKEMLQKIVSKELLSDKESANILNPKSRHIYEFEPQFLPTNGKTIESVIDSFINFVEENKTIFDEHSKNISLNVIRELTSASYDAGSAENSQMEILIKKIEEVKTGS